MQTWLKKLSLILGIGGWILATTSAAPIPLPSSAATKTNAPASTKGTAIQAIEQATDPSAVITAFANAIALDRNDPKVYEVYVTRMVDLGLPEMAFHQAELVTTLKPDSGLSHAVIAYVDARRGQMSDAIAAINVAAPLTPTNKFVQSTAGEILAWYDLNADKSQLADNAKSGTENVRKLVSTTPAFTQAYTNAKEAYAAQAADLQQMQQDLIQGTNAVSTTNYYGDTNYYPTVTNTYGAATDYNASPTNYNAVPNMDYSSYYDYGGGYAAPASYGSYYPYYNYYPNYYGYGPGWGASSYWWYPNGWFWGFSFVPFSTTFVFDGHNHHNNFHHHDGKFNHNNFQHGGFHKGQFNNGRFFANNQKNFSSHGNFNKGSSFHHGTRNQAGFFGTPARPNAAFAPVATSGVNRNFHWNGRQIQNAGTWNRNWNGNSVTRQQSAATLPNMNLGTVNQGAAPAFSGRGSQTVRSGNLGNRGFVNSGNANGFVTRRDSSFSQTPPNGQQFNSSSTFTPRSRGNPNAGSAVTTPGSTGMRSAQSGTRQFNRPSGNFTVQRQQSFQQNLNNTPNRSSMPQNSGAPARQPGFTPRQSGGNPQAGSAFVAPGSTAMRSAQPGSRQFARPSSGNFTVQRQQTFQQNFNNGSSRSVISSQMRSSPQSFNRSFATPSAGMRGTPNMSAGNFRGGGVGFQGNPGMSRGGGFQGGGMPAGGGFHGGGGRSGGNMRGGGGHGR